MLMQAGLPIFFFLSSQSSCRHFISNDFHAIMVSIIGTTIGLIYLPPQFQLLSNMPFTCCLDHCVLYPCHWKSKLARFFFLCVVYHWGLWLVYD
jgi:hypothetical protein